MWPEESSAPKPGMFLSRLWPEGHRAASTSGDPGPRPCSESGMPGAGPFLTAPSVRCVPGRDGTQRLRLPVPGDTSPGRGPHASRLQGAVLCPGALCAQAPGDSRARRRGVTARAPPAGGQALAADFRGAATGNPPQASSRGAGDRGDAGTPHCDEPVQDDGCSRSCLNHVNWARRRLRGKTASGMRAWGRRW